MKIYESAFNFWDMQCFIVYTWKYGIHHFYIKYIVRRNTLQMSLENLGTAFPACSMVFNIHGKQILNSFCYLYEFLCTHSLSRYMECLYVSFENMGIHLFSIQYEVLYQCSAVPSLSLVQFFENPWTATCQASLSIINFQSSLMSTESEILSNHLILCCPLCLLPSLFPSIRVFAHESGFHCKWPN